MVVVDTLVANLLLNTTQMDFLGSHLKQFGPGELDTEVDTLTDSVRYHQVE